MITIEDAIKSTDTVIGISVLFIALILFATFVYCNAYRRNIKAAAARAVAKAVKTEREKCDLRIHEAGVDRFVMQYNADREREKQNARISALERENDRLKKLLTAKDGNAKNGR